MLSASQFILDSAEWASEWISEWIEYNISPSTVSIISEAVDNPEADLMFPLRTAFSSGTWL